MFEKINNQLLCRAGWALVGYTELNPLISGQVASQQGTDGEDHLVIVCKTLKDPMGIALHADIADIPQS